MPDKALWAKIHAERNALADDVAGLSAEQLDTPSLCGGWRVRGGGRGAARRSGRSG